MQCADSCLVLWIFMTWLGFPAPYSLFGCLTYDCFFYFSIVYLELVWFGVEVSGQFFEAVNFNVEKLYNCNPKPIQTKSTKYLSVTPREGCVMLNHIWYFKAESHDPHMFTSSPRHPPQKLLAYAHLPNVSLLSSMPSCAKMDPESGKN